VAKVNIKSEKIISFGEFFYVRALFSRFMGPIIDKALGMYLDASEEFYEVLGLLQKFFVYFIFR